MASATAWPPVRIRAWRVSVDIVDHLDRVDGTDFRTDLAALAMVEVDALEDGSVEADRRIRAVEPAEQAVHAPAEIDTWLDARAPAAGPRLRGVTRTNDARMRKPAPVAQLRHAYPSPTAARRSSAGTFVPSSSTAASPTASSEGSPSAAASAPTITRFTNFDPAARRSAGTQRTSRPASSAGTRSPFRSTKPLAARPSATSTSLKIDGSSTTTTFGCSIESCRRIGASSTRVYARNGAPLRSGPYSGNAWTLLPACSNAVA